MRTTCSSRCRSSNTSTIGRSQHSGRSVGSHGMRSSRCRSSGRMWDATRLSSHTRSRRRQLCRGSHPQCRPVWSSATRVRASASCTSSRMWASKSGRLDRAVLPSVAPGRYRSSVAGRRFEDINPGILKALPNPGGALELKHKAPEVTFLGAHDQPDFGTLYVTFYPSENVIELKSLKEYLYQWRNTTVSY